MSIIMTLRIALKALNRNKMRTVLTMLGMIIGVGAVITMVALGRGAQATIEEQVKSAGTNVININAGNFTQGGVRQGQGMSSSLTAEDATALRSRSGHSVRLGRRQLARADHRRQPELVQPGSGRRRRPPADSQLADQVRQLLHRRRTSPARPRLPSWARSSPRRSSDPTSTRPARSSAIRNQPFRVIGVMSPKGQGAFGQDQDDTVFAPYTTVQKKLQGQQHINNITVASETPDTAPVAAAISEALRLRHKLVAGDPDDFTVRTQEEIASLRTETTRTMTVLLAAIAGVSLVVGGIGIMNIMLVSVTERTREIGLRMAIGARGRDVLLQFLVEAIVISLFGGLIGIAPRIRALDGNRAVRVSGRRRFPPTGLASRSASPRRPACFSGSIRRGRPRGLTRSRR